MKNLIYLLGMLPLFLASCHKDDPTDPVDPPVPSYELVAVEYVAVEVTPDFKSDPVAVYRNEGSGILKVQHAKESGIGFSSRFVFESTLAGKLSENEVAVPRVDSNGNLVENGFRKAPFAPGDAYEHYWYWGKSTLAVDLPSNSQLSIADTYIDYSVKASFVGQFRNSLSGEIEQVNGTWYGIWHHGLKSECRTAAIE